MINVTGATLVRPQLMADGAIRLVIDFGELIKFSDIDDLVRKPLTVVIAAEDDSVVKQFNDSKTDDLLTKQDLNVPYNTNTPDGPNGAVDSRAIHGSY